MKTNPNLQKTPTVKINRAKWRTGFTGQNHVLEDLFGTTSLVTEKGYMCCLGFACKQLMPSLTHKIINDATEPAEIAFPLPGKRYKNLPLFADFKDNNYRYSDDESKYSIIKKSWIDDAIRINDSAAKSIEAKEFQLTQLFKENGITLEFVGDYTKKQIKAFEQAGIKLND